MNRLAALRQEFPSLKEGIYLSASTGPLLRGAREVLGEFVQERNYALRVLKSDKVKGESRSLLEQLVNGERGEVVLTSGTSEGVNFLAGGLRLEAGDKVILKGIEHPASVYPWLYQAQLRGIEVKQIHPANGVVPLDSLLHELDSRTRVVIVSHVEYASGVKNDIHKLGEATQDAGAVLCVDACQSVGVNAIDVKGAGIDALVAGCYKRLYGPKGTGFAYIRSGLMETLTPPTATAFNITETEDENIIAYKIHGHRPQVGQLPFARGWKLLEQKGLSTMLFAALNVSLRFIKDIGIRVIESHIDDLVDYFLRKLEENRIRTLSPADPRERSSIVIAGVPYDLTRGRNVEMLQRRLQEAEIVAEPRAGGLRFGVHFFNTYEEIDEAVRFVKELS